METDQRLVIAPMIEGLAYTQAVCDQTHMITNADADTFKAEANATPSSRIVELLDAIAPTSAASDYRLGYTLTVPLFSLFTHTDGEWVIDQRRIDLACRTIEEVDRPVVVYLPSDHFTNIGEKLVEALKYDPVNLMEISGAHVKALTYFQRDIVPWTISDLDAPVNRMRSDAVLAICTALAGLSPVAATRMVAVALLGETYHLHANFEGGISYDASLGLADCSPASRRGFRQWLADTYGTVTALNEAVGTGFSSFERIDPPAPLETDGVIAGPFTYPDHSKHGILNIQGWVNSVDDEPEIVLFVDGAPVAYAKVGLSRPDVLQSLPNLSIDCGWAIDWEFKRVSAGRHLLTVCLMRDGAPVARIGERTVHIHSLIAEPKAADLNMPELPSVEGVIDHPTQGISLLYNPMSDLWQMFRVFQLRRYLDHYARLAAAAGVPANMIFCHQVPVELYGIWSSAITAEAGTLAANPTNNPGVALYTSTAYRPAAVKMVERLGWKRFAAGELQPLVTLEPNEYQKILVRLNDAGAVYVAPYFLSISPERERRFSEDGRFELRSDNQRYGSAEYLYALSKLCREEANMFQILAAAQARLETRDLNFHPSFPANYSNTLAQVREGLPDWWTNNGNVLFCPPGTTPPKLTAAMGNDVPRNAQIVLGCATMPEELVLWGDSPIVVLGENTRFPQGRFACGGGSTIIIGDRTSSTWAARVDCRNGGIVIVGEDGLWATDVQINSDDMHAIQNLKGKRLNAFGGTVQIGRNVWLAFQALVLNGSTIGFETVIGARAVVKGDLPANSVCAGTPAKVIKTGTRWAFEDLP